MGDVAGKGLAAASMVGRLGSAMRAYALEGREPADVVASLNQLMWSEVGDSEMATLIYVVVDPVAGTISWVNAGHPPPLILAADGSTSFLEGPRSVPLGVMPFPSYEAGTAPLPEGGTLLLYTDGLVERPGELLDDGFARLAVAADGADVSAERACDHVLERLVPTGAMADDVALLALHTRQLSERLHLELPPEPRQLSSMRAMLRRWLTHVGATEEDVAETLGAVGEAAANAIEHAGMTPAPAVHARGRGRRRHGGARGPRPRSLARRRGRGPRPGDAPDARAHGHRGRDAHRRGHHGHADPAPARAIGPGVGLARQASGRPRAAH